MAVNELWLARHGETEWTLSRQHTSRTDLDLTAAGVEQSRALAERLRGVEFELVLSSPWTRARRTAELAGFGERVELLDDLREWDYGEYEGVTTAQIRESRPDWELWRDGCPGGETLRDVATRAERVAERVRAAGGRVLTFGHGHTSRVLGAVYLGLPPEAGRHLLMGTASLSIVADEHGHPAIRAWNLSADA